MRFAPVNPADRLVIAGSYAPPGGLPEVIGAEGMGVVEAVGSAVSTVVPGTRVILLSRGNWAEWRCVSAAHLLAVPDALPDTQRSEEHTSELQSLMRNSYAVFCLKKKKKK